MLPVLVAATTLLATVLVAACRSEDDFTPTDVQIELAALNDTYRVSRGLDPHRLDADLCRLCQKHAEWMASRGSTFHGSGENIVCYGAGSPTAAIRMWQYSPPHNGFLLSRSTRAGWGYAVGRNGVQYWAGAFRSDATTTTTTTTTSTSNGYRWRPFGFLLRR
jgi:uncharacterized protein YkwD